MLIPKVNEEGSKNKNVSEIKIKPVEKIFFSIDCTGYYSKIGRIFPLLTMQKLNIDTHNG